MVFVYTGYLMKSISDEFVAMSDKQFCLLGVCRKRLKQHQSTLNRCFDTNIAFNSFFINIELN